MSGTTNPAAPLLRILGLWRGRSLWLLLGLLVSLAALTASVALMYSAGTMVAVGSGVAITAGVAGIAVMLRVFGLSRIALRYLERLATHAATFRALADLRIWFFRGLARSSAGGLGFRRAGDLLSRLVSDVEALDGLYLRILIPLAGAILLLPLLALAAGRVDWGLAVILCVLFALTAFVLPGLAARRTLAEGENLATATAALRTAAADALSGLREVRAFGAEGRVAAAIQAREARLFETQRRIALRGATAQAAAFLLGQAAILAILIFAGTGPAAATGLIFLALAAFEAIAILPRAGVLAGHSAAAAARIIEAAEAPVPYPDPAIPAKPPTRSALRLEGVSFRWQDDRDAVLDGMTLDIPHGSRVAILGPSGAGKSTIAALLLKVAAPQEGRITLGGTDLADLSAHDVRDRISHLSQATHLFDDTIRNNLRIGRPDADDAAIWAALDQAAIGETVRNLPHGLNSWVGEGGHRFSGGQGRRLALARTLLSPAPILILDEPATGLDAATERAFLETLNASTQGRTIILIAHRLTGVEKLDRIWRLSAGRAIAAAA